jgi:hypothetical protein
MNDSDSSGAARPAGSDGGGPLIDWEEAFQYWASLASPERRYQAVADRFGVSRKAVENHGRNEGWRDRLAAIEAEERALADAKLARERAQRRIVREGLIDRSYARYGEQLDAGEVDMRAADFVQVAKLDIASGATMSPATEPPVSRADIARDIFVEVRDVLAPDYPDALEALREHFEETADGA